MFLRLFFVFIVAAASSCNTTSIFIVRHAEKGTTPTPQDPDLTAEGTQRANELAQLMKGKHINVVYSTKFKRTTQTASPLAEEIGKPVLFYSVDTSGRFIKQLLHQKKNVLIVSHSNRILPMLDSISLPHTMREIPDNDYDNLFTIKVKRRLFNPVRYILYETTYGKPSPSAADTARGTMK